MKSRHALEVFPYGNFRNQMADSLILGWETYDARPRFGTNWTGLRGRMAILSEAYSNDPFPARITSTYAFVQEVLTLAAAERSGIKRLVARVGTAAARFGGGPVGPGAAHRAAGDRGDHDARR